VDRAIRLVLLSIVAVAGAGAGPDTFLLPPLVREAAAETGFRPAAVAGSFYPADPSQLEAAVRAYLADARPPAPERPLALLVPHAGYIYSGQTAADAYRQAAGHDYDVIVILGVNHRVAGFQGVSVYDGPGYETPLGTAHCDQRLAASLRALDRRFAYRRDVDRNEHSVEVQIPFVQTVFPATPIVAAVVGGQDQDLWREFGEALASVLARRQALIVVSSDLSHYPPHDVALAADRAVLAAVATIDPAVVIRTIDREESSQRPGFATCACGEGPLVAALVAVRKLGATRATVVSYANSGDAAVGDRTRCVGYGAVAVTAGDRLSDTAALRDVEVAPADAPLTEQERGAMLAFARKTLRQYFATGTTPLFRSSSPILNRYQGAFVTLKAQGRLRGCIGHMAADTPLGQVVGAMAINAAFRDDRFRPLQSEEMDQITIEISVLTPFAPIAGADEIVLGRDGVVIRQGDRSAVFLPQIASEQGWSREEMLAHLCRKAGLTADAWREGAQLLTFQADVFGEPGPR
jgi:hypothetical protein